MINNKTIAVVVPAYNEADQITMVLEQMPAFVDRVIVVDDKSTDSTVEVIKNFIAKNPEEISNSRIGPIILEPTIYNYAEIELKKLYKREAQGFVDTSVFQHSSEGRIVLIESLQNGGVGSAIALGYKWCRDNEIDCTAVMAGDGQMDPSELYSICLPVIDEGVDYVKGNRLIHRSASIVVPRIRYIGNSILSVLTKVASGYWHVSDTQTGYTAISNRSLHAIKLHEIYRSYGMPNDMLVKLNITFSSIKEVPIKPVYNVGEQSKMKVLKVIPLVSILLIRSFFNRLWTKYLIKDFHPLFILYNVSFILSLLSLRYLYRICYLTINPIRDISEATILAFMFLAISSLNAFLFAMWMDMQDNERLQR